MLASIPRGVAREPDLSGADVSADELAVYNAALILASRKGKSDSR